MFCPFYKNKEVFDGFNEMIEAFGGKPMTEEEFRSAELRNQRTGRNFTAMEAAYTIYDRNGGNFLDMTPTGKPSILFLTLLDYNKGNRAAAIAQKSNVYSDEFFNWFGDWTSEDKENVSKVVDANGEPLVVWHGSRDKFTKFKNDSYADGIYFSNDRQYIELFGDIHYPVYLSIKNPNKTDIPLSHESVESLLTVDYIKGQDGIIGHDAILDIKPSRGTEYVALRPNQIKHIKNLGTWSTTDNNIYKSQVNQSALLAVELGLDKQLHSVDPATFFGGILYSALSEGNQVSSMNILNNLISSKQVPAVNSILANVLSKHDIPVIFGLNEFGTPMEIVQKDGGFVIVVDESQIRDLKASDAANMFLHEVVHALTSNALESPKTLEELIFVEATKSIYSLFDKAIPESEISRDDSITGAYILKDIHEFAAEFATNRNARQLLFEKAIEMDKQNNGKVLLKLKRFINAFSNLLFNKRIFKLKQDEFNAYKNLLDNFLVHRAVINRGNITDVELFLAVYSQIDHEADDRQMNATRRANMIRYLNGVTLHASKTSLAKSPTDLRKHIATALNTRTIAIKKTTSLSEEDKIRYINSARSQIDMLANPKIKSIVALSQLAEQTIPQLLSDINEVRNFTESDDSYYMYEAHDNFGTYANIFEEIKKTLNDPEYINELQSELENSNALDKLGAVNSVSELKTQASQAMSVAQDGAAYMGYILTNNLKKRMGVIAKETGSTELDKWLNEMKSIGYDTNSFLAAAGSKDGSSDTTVRAIMYMINKANRAKEKDVYNKASELIGLLNNLGSNESIKDIYEYDEKGLPTANVVRALNYGKQKKAYKEAIKLINKLYGLPENNRRIPDDTTEVVYKSLFNKNSKHNYKEEDGKRVPNKMTLRRAWNLQRNEWLAKNVERKYKAEYYDAYAGLSEETLEAINNIRDRINQIKAKAKKDAAGHYLFDTLTEEDWKILNGLYIERRSLSSFININGTLKAEGTPEYNIAKELQELNLALYDKDREYHDKKAWADARNKVLLDAILKYTDGEGLVNESAVEKVMKKWDKRNSRRKYKTDLEGNALIYKQIDEDLYEVTEGIGEPVFDFNGDGGARYKENKERINKTLALFRDSNTGEVNLDFLPASVKEKIRKLESENRNIRKEALKGNKALQKLWQKYDKARRKVYKKYFVSKITDQWLAKYEYDGGGSTLNIDDAERHLPKWATKLIVRDVEDESGENLLYKYTELVPGDGWISNTERDDLLNPEFEKLSKEAGNEGMSMIPKKELYDNSQAYNKVMNSPTLRALYNGILSTLKEANENFYDGEYTNNYQLPSITGSMWKYMASSGVRGAVKYIGEQMGYIGNGQAISQDLAFGMAISAVLGDTSKLSEAVQKENDMSASTSVGHRADGRQFNVIPPRYTAPLEDPSLISPDLIGIMCEYYDSAMNVKHKDAIKDTIESFMDMLESRSYVKKSIDKESGKLKERSIEGSKTNTYESARKAVDMFLYDIKTKPVEAGGWNFSKTAQLARLATTAINLGASPVVALTGFFTSSYAHVINSIVGNKAYGFHEARKAAGIFLLNWLKRGFGLLDVGNKNSNNKVKGLMERYNLVNQQKNKYKKSHQNRFFKILGSNYIFGMLTQLDYIIKANIAISLALSHKLVDGKFVSKEDIKNRARNLSDEELAALLKAWNEAESVWDVLLMQEVEDENGVKVKKLIPKKGYENAINDVDNMLYYRMIKCAENADGVATETLKAAITTNIFGAAVLIHRQYLPLQIQDRYSKTVWDMDTQLYTQGMFRTVGNALTLFILSSIKDAYIAQKAESDFHWYNAAIKKDFYKQIVFNKDFYKQVGSVNILDRYKNYFGIDGIKNMKIQTRKGESDEEFMLSRARRKHMKKFVTEFIIFFIAFLAIAPLLYTAADDKDNKDELLLQLAAYTARRVEWESFNPYRFGDMINNINTVTAEMSLVDKVEAVISDYMPRGDLFGSIFTGDSTSSSDVGKIKRGVYKGWTKKERNWFKLLLPYHNAYEQYYGSKDKRRYYENKIMQIEKD